MDILFDYMQRRLAETTSDFFRYAFYDICWENKMLGLVGPRGVGKTTLFLQYVKKYLPIEKTLYVTADHFYFSNHSLIDTAETFCRNGGRYLLIDEVHKYDNWSRELKQIYDSCSDLHVYFTGSSILDIEKGESDLSRRAPIYKMQGLSFREYLYIRHNVECPVYSLEQIVKGQYAIPNVKHPLEYFNGYLKDGYYPFGVDVDFERELMQVVSRTLEVDIPQFANMTVSTGKKLKKLMVIISDMVPFKPNMSSLAGQIGISRNNVEDYLVYMEKAGMIAMLKDGTSSLGALGKIEKVYLDNTNLILSLSEGRYDKGNARETFFLNQMRVRNVVTSSNLSDFCINGKTFEVGGKTKDSRQILSAVEGYIVKDEIEFGGGNVIPLWAFGLNY